ncbi:TIGR03086 family metal-binding protein [Spirillospora sp. NPDC047279]|uniref:TIGR03086 family metal-binding protein n=1 Tax=Spirillospora sp. NPDC047279 TaxID=3155478 RepID=UPI0033C3EB96
MIARAHGPPATWMGDMLPQHFVSALDVFEAVLTSVPPDRWDSPSPCEGWSAIDVAGHIIGGILTIEARAAGRTPPEVGHDLAPDDPLAAWHAARSAAMAALTSEALNRKVRLAFDHEVTVAQWLEQYPLELLVHSWDLAQATGQPIGLPADLVGPALQTAEQFAPHGREAGMLGPERPVPADADPQTRLLALFGRATP